MKHLKLFFALFAMLALGVTNAWGAEVTFDPASDKTFPKDGVTLSLTDGTLTNGTDYRVYKNQTMTISSLNGTITNIALTYKSASYDGGGWATSYQPNADSWTSPTASGEQARITKIVVTYTPSGSGETPEPDPDPTPDPETPGSQSTATLIVGENGGVTWTNGAKTAEATVGDVVFTALGTGSNDSKYYSSDKSWRFYTANTSGVKITTPEGSKIVSVIIKWKTGQPNTPTNWSKSGTSSPTTFTPNSGINTNEVSFTRNSSANFLAQEITVNYETSSSGSGSEEPALSVNPENITWEGIAASAEKSEEITVTLSNIEAVMAELSGDNPTAFSIDKDLLEASGKIIVSKNTTIIGDYAAILTITDTDTQTKTIALSMEVVADPEPTGTFEKFTGTIEEGDYVLVANGTTDALKNTITSNRFDCGTVEVAEDKIVNPDKSVIWHIAANDKYWTMYNESATKYAGGTTSKNQGALLADVTDLAKWTITVDGEGVYTFENYGRSQQTSDANNKFLSKNSQNAYWATYASGQKNPVLYKKSDGKQPAGLVYETNKYRTKLGDSFVTPTLTNPNTLNVTYSSSNNDVAVVATDGSVTIKAVGGVEITATFAGSDTHRQGSAKYTICVTEHAGTEADPYSVADARRVIDVMETAESVYATGIVSEIVTAYNATYGNITYNISIDGTTAADQLQAYRGKGVNGENFSSANDIKVGDEVIVKGNLKKHETTYEFDADNQLVSLKREKQQAGLAYATTEYSTTLGESFETPTLTNPNGLTVTYSSDNTSAVEVNEETGEVTIKAVGKAKITATFAGNLTYAPGSASYTITVTAVATLPFAFDGKQADIENTPGMSHDGIDATDYKESPYLKMNTTGDWLVIRFDSQADELSYDIKGNPGQGIFSGTFAVQESEDGSTYTDLVTYTTLETTTTNKTHKLAPASRYVKFVFTEKSNGNVALGNISITKPDLRQEAGIAWSAESTTITIGDAFTAPTLSNPKGLTLSCTSDNEDLATVTNAGVVTLKEGVTGKAVITATYAGNETYKPAEVKCTISVNPKTNKVVILAEYNGQWYALKNAEETAGKVLAALPVNYVGGKLYNVADAEKATIEWQLAIDGTIATFKNGENYISGTAGSTDLKLATTECEWTYDGSSYMIGNRTFLYRAQANGFKNYNAEDNAGTADYSSLPVVTAPVYGTGTITQMDNLTPQMYGTICLENNVVGYEGITFYEVAGKEGNKVIFDEVTELEAGMPYIYIADSETATIVIGEETALSASKHKSLQGTFTQIDPAESNILTGNYILYNNVIKMCGKNCGLKDHKAYFIADELGSLSAPQAQMPGRRRVSLNTTGENAATGIGDVVVPTEQVTKAIINGQLIIIRDGEMYNAQGQRL